MILAKYGRLNISNKISLFGKLSIFLFLFFFPIWNIYYSRILADEGLYYSTIYHNSHDLGIAEQAALRQNSAGRLAVGPPALSHQNPTVCSFACRCRLRSALWSLFQLSPARCLIVRPYAESKFSCRAVVVNILYCNFLWPQPPSPSLPLQRKK